MQNSNDITVWAPLLPCLAAMLLLIVAGVFFYMRRFRREASAQGRQNLISEAERWLEGKAPELVPWNSLSLTDVSDFMTFVYTRFITDKLHGEVKSLSQGKCSE